MDIYQILYKWNLWGEWQPEPGHKRIIVDEICQYLSEPEVITIIGPRRAGKSTVMYQVMQKLENMGIDRKAILHVNCEEPSLSLGANTTLLDTIYDTYRARVNPKGKAYIFLDEVQNIEDWERWVRARNESENIKLLITGSSSQLLSRELGTLLTGRHISFEVYPLSFEEQLIFKNIELPIAPYAYKPPSIIENALIDYMQWGGMPRIVLSENLQLRERLLKRYFEDMLYKDIIVRHNIRDVQALRNIAVYLLTQTGSLISYRRLCDLFSVSQNMVQSYVQYLEEAFLVNMLPHYTLKTGERIRNPMKTHVIDTGLRQVVSFGQPSDKGKIIETLVHRKLLSSKQDGIFYWNKKGEIDLLTRQGLEINQLIQVTYSGLDNINTLQREINSLIAAGKSYPKAQKLLIAYNVASSLPIEIPSDIEIIPVWQFLLDT